MNTLYDHQAFRSRDGGVSRYFVELAREFARGEAVRPVIWAGAYLNRPLATLRTDRPDVVKGWPAPGYVKPSPMLSAVNRIGFRLAYRAFPADLYHPTYYNWLCPAWRMPRVVTVFDMIHERYPELYPRSDPTPARKRRAIREAAGLICISEQTRQDLIEFYNPPPDRLRVIHLGSRFEEVPPAPYRHSRPFFLYVGLRGGYKNFPRLVRAFALSGLAAKGTELVCLGGGPPDPNEQEHMRACGVSGQIRFMEGGDALLAALYRQAVALAYPSRYEGFGLPPLDAMRLGCAVVAGDCGAVREVVDDAGCLVDPDDEAGLADALRRVREDEAWRAALIAAGRRRADQFTWKRCADETALFYRDILRQHHDRPAARTVPNNQMKVTAW